MLKVLKIGEKLVIIMNVFKDKCLLGKIVESIHLCCKDKAFLLCECACV